MRPVLPNSEGALPNFVTLPEPLETPYWQVYSELSWQDPPPVEHVYARVKAADPPQTWFQFVRTLDAARTPRITCPWCAATSYNRKDVEEGYCGRCHDWTRITAAVVLRAADGVELPRGWEGRWFERDGVHGIRPVMVAESAAGTQWTAVATGRFEVGISGGYAEVFEARPA